MQTWILSALGLTSWVQEVPVGNGVMWTVSTMMFFYLVFPAIAPCTSPSAMVPGISDRDVHSAGVHDDLLLHHV